MKKLIVTITALSAIATSTFAQGLVNFATGASAANRISTNSAVGGSATGATAATANLYYYALFASTTQTTINGASAAVSGTSSSYVFNFLGGGTPSTGWELVGIAANSASIGRFGAISQGTTSANQGAVNGDLSITVQGVGGGSTANFVTIGWSANMGTTLAAFEAAYAAGTQGWVGQSAVGIGLTLGDGSQIPTVSNMGTGTGEVPGFVLGLTTPTIVPEPTTLALAGLGGASLLLFRRKK